MADAAALPPPPDHRRGALLRQVGDLSALVVILGAMLWGVVQGAQSLSYNWQWYRVPRAFYRVIDGDIVWGPLVRGLIVTLEIMAAATPLALAVAVLVALLRVSRSWVGHALATGYLELTRNTPLLVQMYLFYFVLSPLLGIDRFWTGVICLALFEAAFMAEIIRGAILSVPRGQWECGAALGLRQPVVYARIVLPQAAPIMAPPMTSAVVNLIKNSAIVSTIAIFDLSNQARNVIADTFLSFEIWLTVAAMYLVLTLSLSAVAAWLEARAGRYRAVS